MREFWKRIVTASGMIEAGFRRRTFTVPDDIGPCSHS
jgi:hypothetical protein